MTQTRQPGAATVVLVDDSELTCESVKTTLGDAGIEVHTLNGPFGFIKLVREIKPCVILIDVGLGTMNGSKLVRLARDQALPGTRILLYSGRTPSELARDAEESGADGFISKAVSSAELVLSVKAWVARAG